MTVEWSMSSSLATSCISAAASMTALNWSLSTSTTAGHYTPHLQGCPLLCKTPWATVLYCKLAVPESNALLMLWAVSAALGPSLNSNKKITWICFLSNISLKKWKWKSFNWVQLFATPWTIHPWNSPDQNTEVGSCSLLQGIFPTQGSNPGLLHCRWILYQLSHKGSPSLK